MSLLEYDPNRFLGKAEIPGAYCMVYINTIVGFSDSGFKNEPVFIYSDDTLRINCRLIFPPKWMGTYFAAGDPEQSKELTRQVRQIQIQYQERLNAELEALPRCCEVWHAAMTGGSTDEGGVLLYQHNWENTNDWYMGIALPPINFCPWCGKKI